MRKYIVLLLLALGSAALLTACSKTGSEPTQTVTVQAQVSTITAEELNSMLGSKDFTLVNVHIPYAGEIPQTDLFVPFNALEENKEKLPQDKSTKIVLYCRSGGMSAAASQKLLELGYKYIFDVKGGMNAWSGAGYKLIEKQP